MVTFLVVAAALVILAPYIKEALIISIWLLAHTWKFLAFVFAVLLIVFFCIKFEMPVIVGIGIVFALTFAILYNKEQADKRKLNQ